MEYGLIGMPLGHSFSKTIHSRIDDYDYVLRELPPEELEGFLAARDFRGVNVTIPYKQAVIPYLDALSDSASAIGAVNTVVNRGGKLYGDNTDFGGMRSLIQRTVPDYAGAKVLILGTGGTSRTAMAVARSLGAAEVYRISRSGRDGALTYEEAARRHADAGFLINATPCGMYPDCDGLPLDLSAFPALRGVTDVIFNPLRTRLVLSARARGIPAAGGLYMLVEQAVLAAAQFTGKTYPARLTERIYADLAREKENLVLIGMPGAGKTTVGRLCAEALGRAFADLDAVIAERAGRPVAEIFAAEGEAAFRAMEKAVTKEFAAKTGLVIAAGGGTVLDPDNVRRLRQNGRLALLQRPLEDIVPTADRPLSSRREQLEALAKARGPIYAGSADFTVSGGKTPEDTAKAVMERFQGI